MRFLISSSELTEGRAKGVSLEGLSYIVLRYQQKTYVYRNQCPHLGIPLEWQPDQFLDEDGELLRCSTHGALFTIEDGLCISGPCSGKFLQVVQFKEHNGEIFLT